MADASLCCSSSSSSSDIECNKSRTKLCCWACSSYNVHVCCGGVLAAMSAAACKRLIAQQQQHQAVNCKH
jgi:hypothetical protein